MSLSIINCREASSVEWDTIWRACDYATYFHSREWGEIWMAYTEGRMRPNPLLISFSDTKRALLTVSTQSEHKGCVTLSFSSPAGTFGGWVSSDVLTREHADLLSRFFTKKMPNLTWRINPYCKATIGGLLPLVGDHTRVISLDHDFDKIFKKWSKGNKAAVKQSERYGVTTKIADNINDWEAYYAVYQDSISRWGSNLTSSYDWKLFRTMFELHSDFIRLWIANFGNKTIAGALCLYANNHVAYWHGASLQNYFNLRSSNLLLYEAIKNACTEGYSWFDFNPSSDHAGVEAFKKSFGTITLPAPIYQKTDLKSRLVMHLANMVHYFRQ
jgi:hypothetical protein